MKPYNLTDVTEFVGKLGRGCKGGKSRGHGLS